MHMLQGVGTFRGSKILAPAVFKDMSLGRLGLLMQSFSDAAYIEKDSSLSTSDRIEFLDFETSPLKFLLKVLSSNHAPDCGSNGNF